MTEETRKLLLSWADKYETESFVFSDPIQFPRKWYEKRHEFGHFEGTANVEISAVITSWLSYGNRMHIIDKAGMVYDLMSKSSPYEFIIGKKYISFKSDITMYRFYKWSDFYMLCKRLENIYKSYGSIGEYIRNHNCDNALQNLIHLFRGIKGFPSDNTSACKRMCMMLRWLVRHNSPVDIGIWSFLDQSRLLIPLDTHVHRIALELGLTSRKSADMKTAVEITETMKEIFPYDPSRGDFALFGYGIEHK